MLTNFKYTLLSVVRNPGILFWPLAFPIIMALLFNFMFASIGESYLLQPVALAVVADEAYDSALGLDETLRSVDADDDQHIVDLTEYETEAEARKAVLAGDAQAYLTVADNEPQLHVPTGDLNESNRLHLTAVSAVLDGYVRVWHELQTVAREDPSYLLGPDALAQIALMAAEGYDIEHADFTELMELVESMASSENVANDETGMSGNTQMPPSQGVVSTGVRASGRSGYTWRPRAERGGVAICMPCAETSPVTSGETNIPEVMDHFLSDHVRTSKLSLTRSDPDPSARYFYALLGMAASFGAAIAFQVVHDLSGKGSALGARRTVSGTPRSRLLVSALAASWLLAFGCLLVGFAFMRCAIHVDFGDRSWPCVLGLAVSSFTFCAMGALLGSFASLKSVVVMAVSLPLSFFAGLYGTASQRVADGIAATYPQLAALNPIRSTAQLFYSLLYYDTLDRFRGFALLLTAMGVVMAAVAALRMRRQSYATL